MLKPLLLVVLLDCQFGVLQQKISAFVKNIIILIWYKFSYKDNHPFQLFYVSGSLFFIFLLHKTFIYMNTYIHTLKYLGKSDLILKYTQYIWFIQIIVINILKKKIILIKILLIILNHKIYYVSLINDYSLGLLGKSRKVKFLTSKIT